MKKQLLILGLAGVFLTSCDPLKDEGNFVSDTMTAESLLQGATFAQYDAVTDENGNVTYTPSDMGNYIQYNFPNVSAVTAYYMKNGEQKVLAYGRSGAIVYYMPSRGSDPVQTLYFSYLNQDGTEVVAEKQFTMNVAQALEPAVKVLVSNAGVKKWKWMPTNVSGGAVWGNGGYLAGAQDGGLDINGAWWGCGVLDGDCAADNNTFSSQTQHTGGRYEEIKGECYALSYMEFNEDGSLNAYSPEGVKINEGSFSIKDYNNNEITNAEKFSRGTLETSAGAILWPFAINNTDADFVGEAQPTSFDIGYLDPSRMILIYSGKGGGGWSECTWWSFMSDDDAPGILASHDWHWKASEVSGGAVWGNGGYLAGSQDGTGAINGAWWGCGTEDGPCAADGNTFSTQTQHTMGLYDKYAGDTYNASKMVFNEDESSITVYDQNGNQIRQGSFSTDMTPNPDTFSIGTLSTSEGTILWPFAINNTDAEFVGQGMPTSFEIGYLGSDALILIYAGKGGGSWSECTWWSFGK